MGSVKGHWKAAVAAVALVSAVTATAALAAARPISPAANETVRSSNPVFRWELPANERLEAIYVARRPDTTPEGRFFSQNIAASDVFTVDTREWAPESPLSAGSYWWNVATIDRGTAARRYSAPSPFSIAPSARVLRVRVRWERLPSIRELELDVRWSANTREASLTAELFAGRRRLWRARKTDRTVTAGSPETESLSFALPRRVKPRTRLLLRTTVRAASARHVVVRRLRAPLYR
jgi:hypothetical protein